MVVCISGSLSAQRYIAELQNLIAYRTSRLIQQYSAIVRTAHQTMDFLHDALKRPARSADFSSTERVCSKIYYNTKNNYPFFNAYAYFSFYFLMKIEFTLQVAIYIYDTVGK